MVEIKGCGFNAGTGQAMSFGSVRDVRVTQSWVGYFPTGNRSALYAGYCDFVKIEGLRLIKALNHIELFNTKRAVLENCYLQGNAQNPNGVMDLGGNGVIEVDEVKYKNGLTQY